MSSSIDIRSLIPNEFRVTALIKNHRGSYLKRSDDKSRSEVNLIVHADGTFNIQDPHTHANLTIEGSTVHWSALNGSASQRFEVHRSPEADLPHGLFCIGPKKYLGVDLVSFLKIETNVVRPALGAWESFHIAIQK